MKPLLTFLGIVVCCALFVWCQASPERLATVTAGMDWAQTEAVLLVFGGIALYCLPLTIALARQHRQGGAISLLNLLLGWTLLGWVGALIWAVSPAPTDGAAP
jgi:Superinfection immunity protein